MYSINRGNLFRKSGSITGLLLLCVAFSFAPDSRGVALAQEVDWDTVSYGNDFESAAAVDWGSVVYGNDFESSGGTYNSYGGIYDSYGGVNDSYYGSDYEASGYGYGSDYDYYSGYGGYGYGCDYYCNDVYYDEYSYDTTFYDVGGARYSYSTPHFASAPVSYSAPVRVANSSPSYPVSYPVQNPVYVPNQPAHTSSNITNTSVTNIDNSINGSFNDYSINNSFNTNSNNTAIAQSTTGEVAYAAVTPGYTVAYTLPTYSAPTYSTYAYTAPRYTAPVVRATPAYVALSQIPYTGFDLGPVGNAIYWMSLMSFAFAGGYLLVYYNGGVLAFAGGMFTSSRKEEKSGLPAYREIRSPDMALVAKKEVAAKTNTTDTMVLSGKGIVINRGF